MQSQPQGQSPPLISSSSKLPLQDDMLQRQLLQLVMDNLPECIFWKDINGVYLGCNSKFAEIAGVGSPENIVGKNDYELPWKKKETDFFRSRQWFRTCYTSI